METPMTAAQWLDHTTEQIAAEFSARSQSPDHALQLIPRRRAVLVIRVSKTGKRKLKGDRFVSPTEQRERATSWAASQDIDIVREFQEFDVSAHRTPLAKRKGLLPAIELIERAGADILVVAYFDRLVRNMRIQGEVIDRVEAAGGRVVAIDVGEISNATAAKWFEGQIHGLVAEHYARVIGEKTAAAIKDAIARGVPVFPNLPPGYVRADDGRLVVVETERPHIVRVFEMRRDGASLSRCRAYLREHGIERSYRGTQTMFSNRLYLGEIHFGKLVNLNAHEPLVDRELWLQARDRREPRGRPAKSDRLLARLGVLVCGSCGSRLT